MKASAMTKFFTSLLSLSGSLLIPLGTSAFLKPQPVVSSTVSRSNNHCLLVTLGKVTANSTAGLCSSSSSGFPCVKELDYGLGPGSLVQRWSRGSEPGVYHRSLAILLLAWELEA